MTKTTNPLKTTQRLDTLIVRRQPSLSRAQARQLIREGKVLLDGHVARGRPLVSAEAELQIDAPEPVLGSLKPREIALEVLHEDADIIVVNKQAGLPMHPIGTRFDMTLANALLHRCPDMVIAGERRPGLVHRLDRDTSGVIVAAKNTRSLAILARQFQRGQVYREYLALVQGWPEPPAGAIDAPLAQDPGKPGRMMVCAHGKKAVTHYETIERLAKMALLRVSLKTGRTHQIRVHALHIGHPVLGDWRYAQHGAEQQLQFAKRQMLHALRLIIRHPATNQFAEYLAPLPEDFCRILRLNNATSELPAIAGVRI